MKKTILTLILSLTITSNSLAFVPLAAWLAGSELAPWLTTSVVIHTTGVATGLYYYYKKTSSGGASPVLDSSGNVTKEATVEWVDLTMIPPVDKTQSIKAALTNSKIKQLADADPLKYPNTKAAVTSASMNAPATFPTAALPLNSTPYANGTILNLGSQAYRIDNYKGFSGSEYLSTVTGSKIINGTLYVPFLISASQACHYMYNITPVATPAGTPGEFSPTAFASTLAQTSNTGSVKSIYAAELEAMLNDPSYVPTFTDAAGMAYVPPAQANVATPAQVKYYNASNGDVVSNPIAVAAVGASESATLANIAANSSSAAATAAQAAATQAQGYATAAAQNLSAAQAASAAASAAAATATAQANASGTAADRAAAAAATAEAQAAAGRVDIAKGYADLTAAIAAGAASQAAAAQSAANQAAYAAAEKTARENDRAASVPANEPLHQLDFSPLHGLKDKLSTTYPFNLPQSIGSFYTTLSSGAGVAPSFELPMPGNNKLIIDLAIFDPVAAAFRFINGLIITAGCMYYVIHFYRGVA